MKRKVTFLCAVFLCIAMLAGCGDVTGSDNTQQNSVNSADAQSDAKQDEEAQKEKEQQEKQEELQKQLEAQKEAARWNEISEYDRQYFANGMDPNPAYPVDWNKCFEDTKADIMKADNRIVDASFKVDEEIKTFFFTMEVVNGIVPHETVKMAETMLERFDHFARVQDPTIPEADISGYGEVFTKYRTFINVYQTSEKDTPENWFIKKKLLFNTSRVVALQVPYALKPLEPIPEK